MKHTQGKWQIDKDHQTHNTGHITICVGNIQTGEGWNMVAQARKNNEVEANANLIAAAPEMLEELKNLQKWFDTCGPGTGKSKPNTFNLEYIIAKAEGK